MSVNRRIALFFAVTVLFNLAANFAHPVTPTFFQQLGLADYLFGYALATMLTLNFLLSPFWGKLNSLISSRTSMLIACLGYALGQVFFALATSESEVLIARAFAGVFTGGTFVTMLNYIINTAPDGRTRGVWLTICSTIGSVAGAFGYFIGGMLGVIDIRLAFGAQVVCLCLSGFLYYIVCIPDTRSGLDKPNPAKLIKEANPFAAFSESTKFMSLTVAVLLAVVALHSLGTVGFDQSFNYYLKDQFNFSSAYNGTLKAIMGLVTLIANSTVCLWLIRNTDVKRSIIALLLLCTLTALLIVNMGSVMPFLVLNVCFYAIGAICMPLFQSIVAGVTKAGDSNLVMGLYNSIKSLGSIIGAAASGSLYVLNPKFPFHFAMIALAFATLGALFFRKRSILDTD